MTNEDAIEQRLKELTAATISIRARPDFGERVMLAVNRSSSVVPWWGPVAARARLVIPIAALASLAAMAWAVQAQKSVDQSLARAWGSEVVLTWEEF